MNCQHCNGTGAIVAERRMTALSAHRRDYDDEHPCPYCAGTGEASTTPHEIAEQPAKCAGCSALIRVGKSTWRWWGMVFCSLRCCNETKTQHDRLYRKDAQ